MWRAALQGEPNHCQKAWWTNGWTGHRSWWWSNDAKWKEGGDAEGGADAAKEIVGVETADEGCARGMAWPHLGVFPMVRLCSS